MTTPSLSHFPPSVTPAALPRAQTAGSRVAAGNMYVLKRDGSKEEVHFDKITARIRKLTYGLDKRYIDPVRGRRCRVVRVPRARTRTRPQSNVAPSN
jgi:hypothetical protein